MWSGPLGQEHERSSDRTVDFILFILILDINMTEYSTNIGNKCYL